MDYPDTSQHGPHIEGQSEGKSTTRPSQLPLQTSRLADLPSSDGEEEGPCLLSVPGWGKGLGSSPTPCSVVQPPPSQEAAPASEEELPPPQLPAEEEGECLPWPRLQPAVVLLPPV